MYNIGMPKIIIVFICGTASFLLATAMSIYPYERWNIHDRLRIFWILIGLGVLLYVIALYLWFKTKETPEITPLIAFKKFIYNRISENLKIHLFVLTWKEPKKHQIALNEMLDWRFLAGIAIKIALGEEAKKKFFCRISHNTELSREGFSILRDPLLESPDTDRLVRLFESYRNELTRMYNEITEVNNFNPVDLSEYERNLVLETKKKKFIFW